MQESKLSIGKAGQVRFVSAPLDVGIAPNRTQPRAWSIDEHAIEQVGKRQCSMCGDVHGVSMVQAGLSNCLAEQRNAARANVACDEDSGVRHVAAHDDGLSARRTAQVERSFAGLSIDRKRHELRRLILHEKLIVLRASKRVAGDDAKSVRSEPGVFALDALCPERRPD
jgi:hypothetical protein